MMDLRVTRAGLRCAVLAAMICGSNVLALEGIPQTPDSTYRVTITMSTETVNRLAESGFSLYGFKAVGCADLAGVPLVWFRGQSYSLNTVVSWQEQYQAYIALQTSAGAPMIHASASYVIAPGQTLEVLTQSGLGRVVQEGTPGVISIQNPLRIAFTCGISQMSGGVATPISAFPLNGKRLQLLTPLKKVLLMFATVAVEPGTALSRSYGPGVLIDFSGANQREVSFDINTGWSWGGSSWAREVPANTNIVPLLIVQLAVSPPDQ